MLRRLKRLLRSPWTITAELASVAILGAVSTALPNAGDAEAWRSFAHRAGGLGALPRALGFGQVTGSWLFVAALAFAAASLSIVLAEQVDRVRRTLGRPTDVRFLQAAQYRCDFTRPARPGATSFIRTRRRFGSLGSPLFHAGLLVVAVAGLLRALFAADAQVDLLVGETLAPAATAWGAQWGGPLARPFTLADPVTLREVQPRWYPSGELQGLGAVLEVRAEEAVLERSVGVNEPVDLRGGTLYVSSFHGPAALLLVERSGGPPLREVLLLAPAGGRRYEKSVITGDGALLVAVRATGGDGPEPPESAEARVLAGPREVYRGPIRAGQRVEVPDFGAVTLAGWTSWIRLNGTRDPSIPVAYTGLAAIVLGAVLLFAVIRVDTMVAVETDGVTDRVTVALRAERLAPIFRDRFDALVAREGGKAPDADPTAST